MTPYGVALALAFGAGMACAWRRARIAGLDPERVLDASLVILPAAIVGARALWVATHLERFGPGTGSWLAAFDPLARRDASGAGLSMLGGVALAAVACTAYLALRGLPVLRYADALAPSVALGEGITRIGCALQGCCAGSATSLPWAVRGVAGEELLHPVQLYSSLAAFAGFAALLQLDPRRPSGSVFFALLAWLGAARLGSDAFRAYDGTASAMSSLLLASALAAAGLAGLLIRRALPARPCVR